MPPWDKYQQPAAGQAPAAPGVIYGAPDPYKAGDEVRKQQDQALQIENARRTAAAEAERLRLAQEAQSHSTEKDAMGNEGQGKNAMFLLRALGAENDYGKVASIGPRGLTSQTIASKYPDATNSVSDPDRQRMEQAQRTFINSVLRLESGAVIGADEMENYRRQFFPQPGETDKDVLEQKKRARELAIAGLEIGSGPLAEKVRAKYGEMYPDKPTETVNYSQEIPGGLTGSVTDTSQVPPPPPSPQPGGGGSPWQAIGAGVGDIVEGGLNNTVGIVSNPLSRVLGEALGYHGEANIGRTVREGLGLPQGNATVGAINQAAAGGLGAASLARGAAGIAGGVTRNALAEFGRTPIRDMAAGAGAGAGGELGNYFGGPAGQVVGTIAGGIGGHAAGGAGARQLLGERTPNALMRNADEMGVTMMPADVGGTGTRMATGAFGRTLGGIPIAEGARSSIDSAGAAVGRTARGIGEVTDNVGAGQATKRGFEGFEKSSRERADELYGRISVPAESKVKLENTRGALEEVTRGMQSNPELSKIWANHPRLRATLEALTPTDTRPAGQVRLASESDRLRGVQDTLANAKAEARKALDDKIEEARQAMSRAQDNYDTVRSSVSGPADIAKAGKTAEQARAAYLSLRDSAPESAAIKQAEDAVAAVKTSKDEAFIESRQLPTGGELSWKDMNRFRSIVGEVIGQPGVKRDGSDIAALRKLYAALSTDMEVTAAHTNPRALSEFRRATQFWRGRESRIDEVFATLLGKDGLKSDEAVFKQINTWAQKQGGDFSRLARTIRSMPKDESDTIRATIVQRMGLAKKGAQEGAGDKFAPAEFATQWQGMSDRAKMVLFPNQQHRQDLDKLANVMDNMKRANDYANFSNTSLGVNATAQLALAYTAPVTSAVLAATQFGAGKLLSSPRFARIIASSAKLPAAAASKKIGEQLKTLAANEPILASDIRAVQDYLAKGLAESPMKAAAQQEPDRRRPPPQ